MKYYPLSSPTSTASQIILNHFHYASNVLFDNCTDSFVIQREDVFGTSSYVETTVRVTPAINNLTSRLLGDDFKQIIHNPNDGIDIKIGDLYYFSDNYWISIFSDAIKSTVSNGTVRRANNMLKWIDDSGVIYQEAAIIDYDILGNRNLSRQDDIVLPQGYVKIFCQCNERTEKIKPGQRFLVGRPSQPVCWRVLGNGEMNAQMQITTDNTSSRLLTLTVEAYEYDPQTDNLELGICNYYDRTFSISLSSSSISGNVGEVYNLGAVLELNGTPISGSFTYESSASAVATIDSSGSVTLAASGSATATAYMGGNTSVSASALVTVTASGTVTNEVRVTPSDNASILEGDTTTFTVYLYTNGVQQADAFTFAVADANVPIADYTLTTLSSNSFTVENNIMCLEYPLLITATSGSYSKTITIHLNGAF